MKNMRMLLALVLCASFTITYAQMSKEEKKAAKKEIKAYKKDPAQWIKMKEDHKKQVADLEAENEKLKEEIAKLEKEVEELIAKIEALNKKYNNLLQSMPSTKLPTGTVYQVQMGYFQHLDLVSFNNKLKIVKAEEVNGAKRYVIGYFVDLMDAWQFAADIKQLGIDDAFVTKYDDGVRDMDFDALDAIDEQ
jgi:TolA-binding protein